MKIQSFRLIICHPFLRMIICLKDDLILRRMTIEKNYYKTRPLSSSRNDMILLDILSFSRDFQNVIPGGLQNEIYYEDDVMFSGLLNSNLFFLENDKHGLKHKINTYFFHL